VRRHATSCDFAFATVTATVMQLRCDCDATRNKHVHFSVRLHEVSANDNARIGMGVVDQLWRHLATVIFTRFG